MWFGFGCETLQPTIHIDLHVYVSSRRVDRTICDFVPVLETMCIGPHSVYRQLDVMLVSTVLLSLRSDADKAKKVKSSLRLLRCMLQLIRCRKRLVQLLQWSVRLLLQALFLSPKQWSLL